MEAEELLPRPVTTTACRASAGTFAHVFGTEPGYLLGGDLGGYLG